MGRCMANLRADHALRLTIHPQISSAGPTGNVSPLAVRVVMCPWSSNRRLGQADHPSWSHHSQPGGAGGHPGGGRHRRLGRTRAATTISPTAPTLAMAHVMTIDIAYIPAESVSGGEVATAWSTSLRKLRPIASAEPASKAAPRSASTRCPWWRRTDSSSRIGPDARRSERLAGIRGGLGPWSSSG